MALTHVLLVKLVDNDANDAELTAIIAQWRHRHAPVSAGVHAHRGAQSTDVYVYFELAAPGSWSIKDRAAFEATLTTGVLWRNVGLTVDRLECMLDVPGASYGDQRVLHYVVETDIADGWQDEIRRWYDTEHMTGLAGVPGCIRARRFINHDHGPQSFACYDLARVGVTESPPWLEVRASRWSDRVRPQFRNPKRTMFNEIALPAEV